MCRRKYNQLYSSHVFPFYILLKMKTDEFSEEKMSQVFSEIHLENRKMENQKRKRRSTESPNKGAAMKRQRPGEAHRNLLQKIEVHF